jgi:hypothetical protein
VISEKGVFMEFAKRFSVVFAISLALMGCGSSLDKQVSQLAETVTKLQQETAQSKEAISRLQQEIAQARGSISKMELEMTQSIKGAVSKLEQDKALAQLKETLTKQLQQEISQSKENSKPGEEKAPPKEGPEKSPTQ